MSRNLVIGLDLGTTACKALAVSVDGRVEASAAAEYPLHTPQPGIAEQDVGEIYAGACKVLAELTAQMDATRLAGLSLSGAMHCVMPVDSRGEPLSRAMTWADNRAIDEAKRLREANPGDHFYRATGCPIQWLYLPAKLRWMRTNQPDVFKSAARFVAIKDWILHRLTDVWATDLCLSSGSGMVDLSARRWCKAALELAGVEESRLVKLHEPRAVVAEVTTQASHDTGLPRGLPVIVGGGDGGMANIGAGAATPGKVVVTVGTSGAVRITTDRPLLDAKQRTWCYILSGQHWYAGGAINNAGLAVESVRRLFYSELPKDEGFAQLFAEAQTISPGSDGVLFLPYFTGERNPHWRPDLRAAISGLTSSHSRAHVARAVLEGVAFCLADVWAALRESLPEQPASIQLTGGITRSAVWSRIVCDVLGLPMIVSECGEASALGAAAVGHWGLNHIPSLAAFDVHDGGTTQLEPDARHRAVLTERHAAFQREGNEMMRAR